MEQLKAIKHDFSPAMQQIAAYFYPTFFSILPDDEQKEMLAWNSEIVDQKLQGLNAEEKELIKKHVPVAIQHYEERKDKKGYLENHPILFSKKDEIDQDTKNKSDRSKITGIRNKQDPSIVEPKQKKKKSSTSNDVGILSNDSYRVTEFQNEYNYTVDTEDLVDSLYHTANRSVTDLFLQGKKGLDINLKRSYNSLQSKILEPEYTASESNGEYNKQSGNAANAVNLNEKKNYISVGWSLNIPVMQRADIKGEIRESQTTIEYNLPNEAPHTEYLDHYLMLGVGTGLQKVSFTWRMEKTTNSAIV